MTWLDKYLQKKRVQQARPFLRPGDRLLEAGCADGIIFENISHLSFDSYGIDPQKNCCKAPAGFNLVVGQFPTNMPDAGRFDVITLLAVVEHFPRSSHSELADGCSRFLKPGGKIVVTVPSPVVDYILTFFKILGLVKGMSLDEHYGFSPALTKKIFCRPIFELIHHHKFQFGLNNIFVFLKR